MAIVILAVTDSEDDQRITLRAFSACANFGDYRVLTLEERLLPIVIDVSPE